VVLPVGGEVGGVIMDIGDDISYSATGETDAVANAGGVSGAASGALDAESPDGRAHANRYYESIRHRTSDSDVKNIARNINFPEKVVQSIKNHIFLDEHDLGDGVTGRFSPDYNMAQAWWRLEQGTHTELDIMLLKHELIELTQMRRHGYDYETAHEIAEKYHNWAKALKNKKGER